MPAEIYWTLDGDDGDELIPGRISRVVQDKNEIRIVFEGQEVAGQSGRYGDRFHGVIRLRLTLGDQTFSGVQDYVSSGANSELPFSISGRFEGSRYEDFSGTWFERSKICRVDIVGLPAVPRKAGRTSKIKKKTRPSAKRRRIKK
jgi:hypothetical protein